ncbi:Multimodular transpeptidase-transglycosylase [hydrothermal vent metagenome]|uniref:peptidoglycan glycosyltransferase n=1 Tax=hydrothermal vent metagenome TaxID=652676 RepID=A0A3B0R428_9ZZZZ
MANRRNNNSNKNRRKPITVGKRHRSDAQKTAAQTRPANHQARRTKKPKQKKPSFLRWAFGKLFYWSLVMGSWVGLIGAFVLATYASDLPDTGSIWNVERQPSITYLDKTGSIIAIQGAAYAPPVQLDQVPPELIDAVLSVEDRRFYSHFGIDPLGLLRAAITNAKAGRIVQGGSTLTQQLAKNLFLSSERTYKRKIQEVMLALWLERKFSKDEILSLYLNRVYFGRGAWGVEAASRSYFGKPVSKLDLGESAMIAGLLKAPNRYSPTSDLTRAERRATIVLDVMVKNRKISPKLRELAFATPIRVRPSKATPSASYFIDWLAPKVRRQVGEVKTDLIVTTTLDLAAQRAAERALSRYLTDEQASKLASQGALVALDQSGAVQAMAGGKSYAKSQFNRATQARRQPGSAFKPFVYLAAIEAGLTPWTIRDDKPISIGDWSPQNYKKEYKGEMSLTTALAKSVNTIAVQLTEETGRSKVARTARRLGLNSSIATTRSMSLGSNETSLIELSSAYAPFANGGYRASPHGMVQIKVREGPVLWQRNQVPPSKVIETHDLAAINLMLQAVVSEGTGRRARISGVKIGGKTGTTNDFRDAWFIGYGRGRTAGVWVGDDKNRAMDYVTGGTLPTSIWHAFMAEWLPSLAIPEPVEPPQTQIPPPQISEEPAPDDLTGLLVSLAEKLE